MYIDVAIVGGENKINTLAVVVMVKNKVMKKAAGIETSAVGRRK